ncbi:hypothetical protein SANA_17770 [Gottschalkiaceae bacterium SANA]|nr:hypothetical protein SANA_17770 [Gottschalkiaceae bacterium SANA]
MKINNLFKKKTNENKDQVETKKRAPLSQQSKNLLQYLPLVLVLLLFVLFYMPKSTELKELRAVKETSQQTLDQINQRIAEQGILEEQYFQEIDQIELNSDQWYIQSSQTLIVRDVNNAFSSVDLEYEYINFTDLVKEETTNPNLSIGKIKFYTELTCNYDQLVNLIESLHLNLKSVNINVVDLDKPEDDLDGSDYTVNLETTLYVLLNETDV